MITKTNYDIKKLRLMDVVKIFKNLQYLAMAAIYLTWPELLYFFCQRAKHGVHTIIFCGYQSKFDLP